MGLVRAVFDNMFGSLVVVLVEVDSKVAGKERGCIHMDTVGVGMDCW